MTAAPGRFAVATAVLLAISLAVAAGLDRYGKGSRHYREARLSGRDALTPTIVEDGAGAYRHWREKGFRGRTILYVARSWSRIDPTEFIEEDPRHVYPLPVRRLSRVVEERFLDAASFLYAASVNGIARGIIAVLAPAALADAAGAAVHSKNAKVRGGEVYSTHNGFPRRFVSIDALPPADEPVLIYVSASAFSFTTPERLLEALQAAEILADSVVLCPEANDPLVSSRERRSLEKFRLLLEKDRR